MLEVALILLINLVVLIGREKDSYSASFFETTCFVLSLPVILLSAGALVALAPPLALALLAWIMVAFNIFTFMGVLAEGGANA